MVDQWASQLHMTHIPVWQNHSSCPSEQSGLSSLEGWHAHLSPEVEAVRRDGEALIVRRPVKDLPNVEHAALVMLEGQAVAGTRLGLQHCLDLVPGTLLPPAVAQLQAGTSLLPDPGH